MQFAIWDKYCNIAFAIRYPLITPLHLRLSLNATALVEGNTPDSLKITI